MRRLALAAALAFGLAGPAAADYWSEFDAGIEAYIDGRHADAIKRFEPLAARGDHRAQYWLGAIYVEARACRATAFSAKCGSASRPGAATAPPASGATPPPRR